MDRKGKHSERGAEGIQLTTTGNSAEPSEEETPCGLVGSMSF